MGRGGGLESKVSPEVLAAIREGARIPLVPDYALILEAGRGTPNHYALLLARELLRAHLWGSGGERAAIGKQCALFLDAMWKQGHCTKAQASEFGSPSHRWIWNLALAALRWSAFRFGIADLTSRTGRWWRSEIAINATCATAAGEIRMPGAREGHKGWDQSTDVIYCLVKNLPLPRYTEKVVKRNGEPKKWWDWMDCGGAWIVRELMGQGDDLGGAGGATLADIGAVRDPIIVERWEGGHRAWVPSWIENPTRVLKPQVWAWCHEGEYRPGESMPEGGYPPLPEAAGEVRERIVLGRRGSP